MNLPTTVSVAGGTQWGWDTVFYELNYLKELCSRRLKSNNKLTNATPICPASEKLAGAWDTRGIEISKQHSPKTVFHLWQPSGAVYPANGGYGRSQHLGGYFRGTSYTPPWSTPGSRITAYKNPSEKWDFMDALYYSVNANGWGGTTLGDTIPWGIHGSSQGINVVHLDGHVGIFDKGNRPYDTKLANGYTIWAYYIEDPKRGGY